MIKATQTTFFKQFIPIVCFKLSGHYIVNFHIIGAMLLIKLIQLCDFFMLMVKTFVLYL